ncbi:MAG: nucleotide sugar dehydrogenase, partial [Bdellovibrionales bacterium]|nr:nucleotide sugar dehydrogenase [Bdellovibrionales bacterium]
MNPIIVSITGLGYVGLPVAIAFSKIYKTIGFDTDVHRINELNNGCDRNSEYTNEEISSSNLTFTSDPKLIESAQFHIIAVPTPLDEFKKPDLSALFAATESIAKILKKGDVVVFESTTYPG